MTGSTVPRRSVLRLGAGLGAAALLAGCSTGRDAAAPPGPGASPSTAPVVPGTVPAPAGLVRTSWSTDPWARGSYSYLPPGATPEDRAILAEPVDGVLLLAGEALDADAPATVHGALASGRAAADRVVEDDPGVRSVVVVGAGVAGAAAAARLAAAGVEVVVVEARDRTGGRVATIRPAGWPGPVELGASWVHDTGASDLADRLDELGVASVPFAYDDVVLGPDGRPAPEGVLDDAADAVEAAVAWAEEAEGPDRSLADALADSGAGDEVAPDLLAHLLRTELTTEYGADADELSGRWGTAEGTEGDDLLVTGGYGALVDQLLEGIDVRLGWPVSTVRRAPGSVAVRGPDGATLTADRVIVTVPLGVLQAGGVEFDPPLPEGHRAALDALAMGLLDKVWLRWDEPWWTESAEQWTRIGGPDDGFVEWFNLLPATGAAVLLGLVGGAEARRWGTATDDEVLAAALASLQRFRDAGW